MRLVVKTETQDPKRCYFAFKPKSCQCSVLGHNKAQKEERDLLRLLCLFVDKDFGARGEASFGDGDSHELRIIAFVDLLPHNLKACLFDFLTPNLSQDVFDVAIAHAGVADDETLSFGIVL